MYMKIVVTVIAVCIVLSTFNEFGLFGGAQVAIETIGGAPARAPIDVYVTNLKP